MKTRRGAIIEERARKLFEDSLKNGNIIFGWYHLSGQTRRRWLLLAEKEINREANAARKRGSEAPR